MNGMNLSTDFRRTNLLSFYFLSIVIFLLLELIIFLWILNSNNNNFVYPFDDTFIHLELAKNFSLYGIFGITNYEVTTASSSPLWSFLLTSTISIFGNNYYIPLFFSILSSIFLLIIVIYYGIKIFDNIPIILMLMLTIMSSTKLFLLSFSGMEHIFFTFLLLIILYCRRYYLEQSSIRYYYVLSILLLLISSIRIEGFIFFLIFGYNILRKNLLYYSLILLFISMFYLSVGYFVNGYINFYLPSKIFMGINNFNLKTNYLERLFNHGDFFSNLRFYKAQILIISSFILSFYFLIINFKKASLLSKLSFDISTIFIFFVLVQFLFDFLFNHRYLNHLFVLFYLNLYINIHLYLSVTQKNSKIIQQIAKILIFTVLIFFNIFNFYFDFQSPLKASNNIYSQQFQFSKFINKYYQGRTIILNDIGAACYFADFKLIDLAFIGSNITFSYFKQHGKYDDMLCENIMKEKPSIAIIYDSWFRYNISSPFYFNNCISKWTPVEKWTINNNYICGDSTITFYSINFNHTDTLRNYLNLFSNELPAGVKRETIK